MVVPILANRTHNTMGGNNLYDATVESYGTINQGSGLRNVGRPKVSTATKVAPLIFIVAMVGLAFLGAVIQKDEKQVDQVICAFAFRALLAVEFLCRTFMLSRKTTLRTRNLSGLERNGWMKRLASLLKCCSVLRNS